jgi:hypothetical protein
MSFKETLKREAEVAFSKHSQPIGFRVVKYVVLGCLVYFLWGTNLLWIILAALLVPALGLHFWYRHKTNGWRKSYGMWKYDGK